tara:strand:- start:17 stop:865 length:849 start_codon:yes stop_codon:yes gene_type:complete
MPHGGYHGTQVIGGKITQLGDEFKDSAGNIKPQFSVTGDKDTGFNVSMAKETFNPRAREAMYASPDDILQNIIDRKDVLKLQASPDRPGMNVYQDTIQDFRTSSPVNAAAYEQRFPLTAGLENIISSGGIFGTLARAAFDQGKEAASNLTGGLFPGAGDTFRGIAEDFAAAPGGFAEDFKTMVGLKDDNPVKGEVREVLGVKKNTPEDIVESSDVFKTEEKTLVPFTDVEFYGGRSPTDDLTASLTTPGSENLKLGRQFYAMNQTPAFANYIKEVEKRLGIQ